MGAAAPRADADHPGRDECAASSRQPPRRRNGGRCRGSDRPAPQAELLSAFSASGPSFSTRTRAEQTCELEKWSGACRTQAQARVSKMLTRSKPLKASQPGNGWSDVSRPLVSGINFAHLALVSEPWPGTPTIDSPHFPPDTPAPLVCCSAGHAPFWLPPHSGGGLLHMLIIGPTAAGKSVLLALLAMAWTALKGARVRWIDFDYSSFVAAHALGAGYRDLGNDGTPALCPLERAGSSDEEDQFLLAFSDRLFARWQTALNAERP